MERDLSEILNELDGLILHPVGSVADMLWVHFGAPKLVPDHYGELREVGEWALHLQCPWRFIQNHRVILASSDFYYAETGEPLDTNSGSQSVFQKNAERLNLWIESNKVRVSSVTYSEAGAFDLIFTDDLKLTVMPSQSENITNESWLLFKPYVDEPHIVFPAEAA